MSTNDETVKTPYDGTLYKVLNVSGHSGSGKNRTRWDLPRDDEPGKWLRLDDDLPIIRCCSGYHLTREPLRWTLFPGRCRVFEAETRGERVTMEGFELCARQVRLLREVSPPQRRPIVKIVTLALLIWLHHLVGHGAIALIPWYGKRVHDALVRLWLRVEGERQGRTG